MSRTNMTSTDLEFGVAPISNPDVLNNPIVHRNNEDSSVWKLKLCMCLTVTFMILPMAFCDLYFGYNDISCVSNSVRNIGVNLHQYLIVSGWMSIGIILVFMIGIVMLEPLTTSIVCFIGFLISLFSFCWNIIGGVIFWSYMDNSTCSQNVFNYVFASLIIKYVFTLFGILSSRSSKD